MKNKKADAPFIVSVILVIGIIVYLLLTYLPSMNTRIDYVSHPTDSNEYVTIANWNLQIFGDSKASDTKLLLEYVGVINDYDIVFVQEIRDKNGDAFPKLCFMLKDYTCMTSSRAGRSSSKEQVGIIYKDDIEVIDFVDYNPDSEDRWERPPIKVVFNDSGYIFNVYNIHIKPDDVAQEMEELEEVVIDEGNTILLGDLNADCSYYKRSGLVCGHCPFEGNSPWNWIIKDSADTTVGSTTCAYDRIIINDDMNEEYYSHEVRSEDITKEMSDHYLISITLEK